MPKRHADTLTRQGMGIIANSPAFPATAEGLAAFREMQKASGMNTGDMLKYIGKRSHFPRQVDNDKVKQEQRLEKLEAK